MLDQVHTSKAAACVAFCGFFAAECVVAGDPGTPQDWIDRMGNAVQVTSYEGTVVRVRDGKVDTYKVAHTVKDGVIREKVVIQDGNGLEIIRNGNEVHFILPDSKSVLVEEWDEQSTFFSTLPTSQVRFGSEYDVSIVRTERVAGRKAVLLAIRPHDEFRFGHRIWLDTQTGFPLQTRLIGDGGETIEQVKFADINLDKEIESSALAPSISTENFRWFVNPKPRISHEVPTPWGSEDLPPGFRVVSSHAETVSGSDEPLVHVLYSDGLANVSVFIEPAGGAIPASHSRVGSSNSFSIQIEGHQVTAVGEVPPRTVERIASSMKPN